MVMILVALVQLKELATIQPGLAVAAFGGVVVLTMLAAMAFDPRLLWQPKRIIMFEGSRGSDLTDIPSAVAKPKRGRRPSSSGWFRSWPC